MAMASEQIPNDRYEGMLETGKPSEVTDDYWIWAANRTSRNNRLPDEDANPTKCGKWLIFEKMSEMDKVWETVKEAVVKGDLGFLAKVRTMKDHESDVDPTSVICVYTYDWTDEGDVFRVREGLRQLGFTRQLSYKTDAATLAGQYAGRGRGGRVCKYYS